MEFKSLKNIETSFRQLRLFGIVYLCVCTLLVFFSVWKAYTFAEAQREKIYVLDEGKSLMLAFHRTWSRTVRWRQGSMSGGSMNCSLRYPLTRVRLRVISNGPCSSVTVLPMPIMWIWQSRDITTGSFRET